MSSRLAEALGIGDPPEPPKTEEVLVVDNGDHANIRDDYREARKNYHKLLKAGMTAIDKLAELSKDTTSPTMFQSLSTLISSVAKVNSDLLDLTEKRAKFEENHNKDSVPRSKDEHVASTREMLARVRE